MDPCSALIHYNTSARTLVILFNIADKKRERERERERKRERDGSETDEDGRDLETEY